MASAASAALVKSVKQESGKYLLYSLASLLAPQVVRKTGKYCATLLASDTKVVNSAPF